MDTEIEQLLSLLSLWAFEANAHLVLEYLIRRYLIHEYNTEALLKSLLVSHDTKVPIFSFPSLDTQNLSPTSFRFLVKSFSFVDYKKPDGYSYLQLKNQDYLFQDHSWSRKLLNLLG